MCQPRRAGFSGAGVEENLSGRCSAPKQAGDRLARLGEACGGRIRTDGKALDMDERHVAQAKESQHATQIWLLEVEGLCWALAVDPAPRRHDEDLLALEQADGALLCVAECATRPGDVVDPGLQGRGYGEIVHRG